MPVPRFGSCRSRWMYNDCQNLRLMWRRVISALQLHLAESIREVSRYATHTIATILALVRVQLPACSTWSKVAALLAAAAAVGATVRPTYANATKLPQADASSTSVRNGAALSSSSSTAASSGAECQGCNVSQVGTSSGRNGSSLPLNSCEECQSSELDPSKRHSDVDGPEYHGDLQAPAARKRSAYEASGKRSRVRRAGGGSSKQSGHATLSSQSEEVPCHHRLWAVSNAKAVDELTRRATSFLALGQAKCRNTVYQALEFDAVNNVHEDEKGLTPKPTPRFMAGSSNGVKRCVRECVFLANYPICPATL
eukprot:6212997-Pleurochrysis_carterae.AAC.1